MADQEPAPGGDLAPYADLPAEERTDVVTFDAERRREVADLAHRDTLVAVLKQRRFDLLPVTGEGAPVTTAQGRDPGDSTTPIELADLISSIDTMGVLQPVLVEERQVKGALVRQVVSGERRVRAVRWGAVHRPENPHFAHIPAVIVPGPLSEEDRRSWQLIENLAREDLRPGELAGALLFERCAILVTKLLAHGISVPREVLALDDPIARFEALERLRGTNVAAAAPWSEVLNRLGLQMSPRKARQLVAAFKALPANLVDEMDAEHVALSTRIRFIELRRGRADAADEIWAAVREQQASRGLLHAAVSIAMDSPALSPAEAVQRAADVHASANQERHRKLAAVPDTPTGSTETPTDTDADVSGGDSGGDSGADGAGVADWVPVSPDPADKALVDEGIRVLRDLVAHLADGYAPGRYDAGSLRLHARNLLFALDNPTPSPRRAASTGSPEDTDASDAGDAETA